MSNNYETNTHYHYNNIQNAHDLVPLDLWYNSQREDNFTTGTSAGHNSAMDAGYTHIRQEGCVFRTEQPGTVPLELWYNSQREDNFTTGTSAGRQSAIDAGYYEMRVEGYAFPASSCQW